jgi:cytochrome c5
VSENEHSTFIKTPRQLIVVIVLSFLIPVLLIIFLTQIITGNLNIQAANANPDAVRERIRPVAQVAVGEPPAAPAQAAAPAAARAPMTGEQVVTQVCGTCHGAGLAGAPKIGDKGAWAARIAAGNDKLYANAIKGKNAMPARGGNASLSDAEVKAAVDRMVAASR